MISILLRLIHMKPWVDQLFILDIGHPTLSKKFLLNGYINHLSIELDDFSFIIWKQMGV